jgi:hypothetical protein
MKSACVFAALVGAVAVAPPRIELSLEGRAAGLSDSIYRAHDQGRTNLDHTHYKSSTTPDAPDKIKRQAVQSRQDWTEKCAATGTDANGQSSGDTIQTCHFPIARAYDFVDQQLRVSTRVYQVDKDDQVMLAPVCKCGCDGDDVHTDCSAGTNIDMTQRATYLFKYDATDNSGNHAEQVVFALIVDDLTAPTFVFNNNAMTHDGYHHINWSKNFVKTATNGIDDTDGNFKFTAGDTTGDGNCWEFEDNCDPNTAADGCTMKVQASRYPTWGLYKCTGDGIRAIDNVDSDVNGKVSNTIRYSIYQNGAPYVCTTDDHTPRSNRPARCAATRQKLLHVSAEEISNYLGDYGSHHNEKTIQLKIHAHDFAGVYGTDSRNNVVTVTVNIVVEDTLPPQCFVHGLNPTHLECRGAHALSGEQGWDGDTYKRCSDDQFNGTFISRHYYCDGGVGCYDELDGNLDLGAQDSWPTGSDFSITVDKYFGTSGSESDQEKFRKIASTCDMTQDQCANSKYEITYTAKDAYSGTPGNAVRTVFVTDTVAPTITLAGVDEQTSRAVATVSAASNTVCEELSHTTNFNGNAVNATHSVCAHSAGTSFYDPGIEIADLCDAGVEGDNNVMSGANSIWHQPLVDGVAGCPSSSDSEYYAGNAVDCWGGNQFNERKVGKYIRTYHIKDTAGNSAKATRTFHVVDMTAPVIEIFGTATETFEASRDVEYTDQGAKCEDYVDGDISHNVEVSGEIVNMKVPGTYHIQYDCQDNNGNMASPLSRRIIIKDDGKPFLQLNGDPKVFVEAGFPYKDEGATATDTLDGDITSRVQSVGNSVSTSQLFYYAGSCQQIAEIAARTENENPVAVTATRKHTLRTVTPGQSGHSNLQRDGIVVKSGEYYISRTVNGHRSAVVVTCDFSESPAVTYFKLDAQRYMQDYHTYGPGDLNSLPSECTGASSSTCDEVHRHTATTLNTANDGAKYTARYPQCNDYGFSNFAYSSEPADGTHERRFADSVFGPQFVFYVPTGEQTDRRLCTLTTAQESALPDVNDHFAVPVDPQLRAETGSYKITYMVTDLNGNAADEVHRDVLVRDTLAPVLTLKYRDQVLTTVASNNHVNAGTAASSLQNYTNLKNPAYYKVGQYANNVNDNKQHDEELAQFGNPQFGLMAQAATTNGWVIAAVASAIAGVALLGFSAKRTETSVPV